MSQAAQKVTKAAEEAARLDAELYKQIDERIEARIAKQ